MTELVDAAWDRITAWLAGHAPATADSLNPPASGDAVADAERVLGRQFPTDLIRWWRRADGAQVLMGKAKLFPPYYLPCGPRYMLGEWRTWREVYLDPAVGGPNAAKTLDELAETPAGSSITAFVPAFVPIAFDGSGGNLVVDLRPGPRHGCVLGFHAEMGSSGPLWDGVAAMLDDVANALERGTPSAGHVATVTADGALDWTRQP